MVVALTLRVLLVLHPAGVTIKVVAMGVSKKSDQFLGQGTCPRVPKSSGKIAKIAFSQQILYKEKTGSRPQITKFTSISCL
ncbi:hypothetical protein Swol_0092 [Syntrophomonas wolfei subsp. wolfei str. Goettingen G311]|uniref:Uncharacterized protein n=1 Tax=Syntrophomonas wolfei subsp. wolfei (strain DSM 2245B / Goettingen) TaxID=335541 RepID=Q0B0Q5_SYNWW|nr:hypothetical protein Swol_0092 [Syntrophomonas wolfei subsp. wolfei str. Goettingen G311]